MFSRCYGRLGFKRNALKGINCICLVSALPRARLLWLSEFFIYLANELDELQKLIMLRQLSSGGLVHHKVFIADYYAQFDKAGEECLRVNSCSCVNLGAGLCLCQA